MESFPQLEKINLARRKNGERLKTLLRIRCDNMENNNKYWLKEERTCIPYKKGPDSMKHFVEECRITEGWFEKLENNIENRIRKV